MLKYGKEYVEKGIDYYEKLYQDRVMKNLSRKALEFGYVLVSIEQAKPVKPKRNSLI
ncbi:hypothetical protein Wxf_02223 [Wolbachia endosymbiont of Armadillidium vulgare]|nr:hypothetical protein Wxf_02223 [Wolbachia endosymbiont of Armadillidium vulgare]